VTICEDAWNDKGFWGRRLYPVDPVDELMRQWRALPDPLTVHPRLVLNISASPFHVGKDREREEMLRVRARDNACFVALCNTVGGQDELVFDGHSVVIDDEGEVIARAPGFEEALLVVDLDLDAVVGRRLRDVRRRELAKARSAVPPVTVVELGATREQPAEARGTLAPPLDDLEQMRQALELGLADYVGKNGFGDVVIGLSGGIDSALTAALAAQALGVERVHGVSMPSRYSSDGTRGDAARLAESLGIDFREIAIEPVVEAFDDQPDSHSCTPSRRRIRFTRAATARIRRLSPGRSFDVPK